MTKTQKEAVARAIYLLKVAAYTEIVDVDGTAKYDGTTCDGYCFQEDASNAAAHLLFAFGHKNLTLPKDTPDEDMTDED